VVEQHLAPVAAGGGAILAVGAALFETVGS